MRPWNGDFKSRRRLRKIGHRAPGRAWQPIKKTNVHCAAMRWRACTGKSLHTPASTPPPGSACARCGAPFTCGAVAGTDTCWCNAMPRLMNIISGFDTCLCPACLEHALKNELEEPNNAGIPHPAGRQP